MLTLIARRLGSLMLTLAAVSALIFVVMDVLPGDPAAIMLGTSASPDTLAALRHELGLDQPLLVRYFLWLGSLITGDLGTSYTYGVPVAGLIAERLTVTLPLAVMAILISVLIAIPLGVASRGKTQFELRLSRRHALPAVHRRARLLGGASADPHLFDLARLDAGRRLPRAGRRASVAGLQALLLPAIALALPQAGVLTRVTRSSVLEVLHEDFVRTARAKGLPRRAALWRHAVPNALVPVITILGLQFTFLIAGAILIENVFNLPGLGRLAYQALTQRDVIVMQDVVLFFAGLVIVMNFLVDLSYLVLDPRLRGGGR